jgi:hypothetical protein
MRTTVLTLAALCHLCLLPQAGNATLSADAIISRAQQQLIVPAEFVLGEMKVYRQDRLHRSYSFIMGRLWDEGAQTEYVRIDFKTAICSNVLLRLLRPSGSICRPCAECGLSRTNPTIRCSRVIIYFMI